MSRRARSPLRTAVVAAVAALLFVAPLAACGSDESSDSAGAATAAASITVFAAASLTGSFTELGKQFEQAHPGSKVTFSFGPSSGLATQITEGAPADVFAAASDKTMKQVADAGLASSPAVFATNSLEIAVPPANPAEVDSLDDLARPGVKVVLCQEQVPCGVAADATLEKAGLTVTPVSREADVKAVLTKVSLNEADAGLVYVTDVQAAGDDVVGVEIPPDRNTSTNYPIAAVTREGADSAEQATAQAFVEFVLSTAGGSVLQQAGFAAP
jgi:molybdate transport system substrate-binding protein